MNLTSGRLYFINEQDKQTRDLTNYYKIGIVRDSDGRDSHDRLLEHQTGNPRKLHIVQELKMPAVEAIETTLHHLFASNRVMGEWMCFTEEELKKAISKANELALEMEINLKNFQVVEELKNKVSNGTTIDSSDAAEELYDQISNFKEVLKTCTDIQNQYKNYLKAAIDEGVNIEGKATIQERAGVTSFDEKLFSTNFPDIFKKYTTTVEKLSSSFRLKPNKNWAFDISILSTEQVEELSEFRENLSVAGFSMDEAFSLHSQHLGVIAIKRYAEWNSDIATVKLKVLTGEAEGIKDICTWKRELKKTLVLDKKLLQEDHPEEYAKCLVQREPVKALVLNPNIASE